MASTSWYDVALNQRKYLSQSLPSLFLFSDTDDEDDEDYETSEEDEIDGPGSQENGESSPYFNYKFAPISSITMETSVSSTEDKSTWKNNKAGAWGEEHVEDTSVYTHSPVPDIRIIEDNYPKPKPQHIQLTTTYSEDIVIIDASPDSHMTHSPFSTQHLSVIESSSYAGSISLNLSGKTISCMDLKEIDQKERSSEQRLTRKSLFLKSRIKKPPNLHKAKSAKKLSEMLANPLVDVNIRNVHKDAPIHEYIRRGQSNSVELLVTLLSSGKNVDVNILDANDNTPLHLAAERNDLSIVRVLLVFGANLRSENAHKQIPLDITPPGEVNKLLEQLLSNVTNFINRSRAVTINSPFSHCTPKMIGYQLSWRHEPGFAFDLEDSINKMLYEKETEDITAAGAAFIQLSHLIKWKKTRSRETRPGSRVLFLDGGGIRGLIQIEILMELERRTGRKITELFDWIVGTSTGGIVALGLVYAGYSMVQLRDLYYQFGQEVFSGGFLRASQNSATFEKILRKVFKNRMMCEVREPKVLIAAVNITNSSLPVEFFNNFDNSPDQIHLIDVPVWMVARATSAGPMYFTSFRGYVDGGVKANNPCEHAMSKIRHYYQNRGLTPPHFPILVSIGTGVFPNQNLGDLSVSVNKTGFDTLLTAKNLFDLLRYAISNSQEVAKNFSSQCRHIKIPFFRFNPSLPEEIKPNETDLNLLMEMVIKTKLYLIDGKVLADMYEMVQVFEQLEDLNYNLK